MTEELSNSIRSWCLAELGLWRARGLAGSYVYEHYRRFNETHPSIFVFNIRDGLVSLMKKPTSLTVTPILENRARLYLGFIQRIVAAHDLDVQTSFALCLADEYEPSVEVPIFGFQKPAGSDAVLFPDIDFITGCYADSTYEDPYDYDRKCTSGLFVGSTTGANLTEEIVRASATPRLRAAEYFRHRLGVHFQLPVIVQCDTAKTEMLLREMGFGNGERIDRPAQMKHKFIISMDGNGATCSRVVIALNSNSVLLKYDSPHILYYFSHLIPWRHYVPIRTDSEIESIVQTELDHPGCFRFIASEGRAFAERYLTKDAVSQYAAELIRFYASMFPTTMQTETRAYLTGNGAATGTVKRGESRESDHLGSGADCRGVIPWRGSEAASGLRRAFIDGVERVSSMSGMPYLEFLTMLNVEGRVRRYLEIGTNSGTSLSCATGQAVAIDPRFQLDKLAWAARQGINLFEMTSDDFFASHDPGRILGGAIDLAFIDGMHLSECVLRDFINIERHCVRDSIIVLHDVIPENFEMTERDHRPSMRHDKALAGGWTGDVWRVVPLLQLERPELCIQVLDCPPTGLVLISNLDPQCQRLVNRVDELTHLLTERAGVESEFWAFIENLEVIDSRTVVICNPIGRSLSAT